MGLFSYLLLFGMLRNIFGAFTGKYAGANRMDKGTQRSIQKRLDKGKGVIVSDVSSSRWDGGQTAKQYQGNDGSDVEEQVSSTCVDTIKYNPRTQEMDMTFRGNPKEYTFPNVPEGVITEWLDSPSKGMYYNQVVKKYSVGG